MKNVLDHFNFSADHEALTVARVGEWQYDVVTDETFLSEGLYDLFEIDGLVSGKASPVPYFSLVHKDDLVHFRQIVDEAITLNKSYHVQHRLQLKSGRTKWILVVGYPVEDANGKVIFLRGICQDITQHKLNHDRLKGIETLFQSLAANVPGLIFQFLMKPNGEMSLHYISEGARQVYEMEAEELIGNPNAALSRLHPDDVSDMKEKILISAKNFSVFNWEGRFIFPGNRIKWIQSASSPRKLPDGSIIWDGLMMDITEKRLAQEVIESQRAKMVSSSKLAALGEMAAGVAHEINNPLTVIHGAAYQIKSLPERGQYSSEVLIKLADKIMETVDRAAKIVRSLRYFARDSEEEPKQLVRLKSILDDTLELCRERFKNNGIDLQIRDIEPSSMLVCRPIQVSQVLLNLLNNAHDAVLFQTGSDQKWVRLDVHEHAESIELVVTDSGDRIPATLREKIFMPFFTTKELGKGTGLGLSLSLGIVKEHGGDLFHNPSERETQFIARFPKNPDVRSCEI